MPQGKNKKSPKASGMGNIRKVTRTVNGKTYTYFEARYTEGFHPEQENRFSAAYPVRHKRKWRRN